MSLTGSLEDLPLTDIIQIISLSKRTGILQVEDPDGNKGYILFKNGFVIGASSPSPHHITLGDMLIRQGILTKEQLDDALKAQKSRKPRSPLGHILVQKGLINQEELEELVKHQIYHAIYEMLKIDRGTFTFSLGEVVPFDTIRLDPMDLILLEKGLNAQQVILDALKTHDEETRDAARKSAHEEILDINAVDATVEDIQQNSLTGISGDDLITQPILEHHVVFLLTPVSHNSAILGQVFQQYDLLTMEMNTLDVDYLIARMREWQEKQYVIGIVLDIDAWLKNGVLPSFLSNVVTKLLTRIPSLKVFLCTTRKKLPADLPELASFRQIEWVLSGEAGETLQTRLGDYARRVALHLSRATEAQHPPDRAAQHLIEQLWKEIGLDEPFRERSDPASRFERALKQLKTMLNELRNPHETPQISLLILQYASEFTDRGVLLILTPNGLVGLGGYGDTGDDEPMPLKVRRLRIPDPPEPFQYVLENQSAYHGREKDITHLKRFLDLIGRFTPSEFILYPIIVQDEVVALFYGDNAVQQTPLGDLTYLEIFMNQAGVALENAMIHRPSDGVLFR